MGNSSYVWDSAEENCGGEADDQTADKLTDPTLMLYPVSAATKVGSETVNGIPATHHRFDQNSLPLADPKPEADGGEWIAEAGGYVVKYTLSFPRPSAPDPSGAQISQTLSYELSGTYGSATVALPEGCPAVLTDIPALPDDRSLVQVSGLRDFITASSTGQVVDFYSRNLPPLGWESEQELPTGDVDLPFSATFSTPTGGF
jgi:hypothetical protein